MSRKNWFVRRWYPHYEGEGDAGAAGAGTGTGTGAGAASASASTSSDGGNDTDKKFTQKDLDALINKRFKAERSQNEKLLQQLQAIQQNGLTPEAREELEGQITRLQESMQTKEQTLQQKMAESEKKYTKLVETTNVEKELWKSRFHKTLVERSILDAAIASDAEEAAQLVLMFGPNTRLEEQVDGAGKGTGEFVAKLKFQGIDTETKKPVVLDLPPGEAFNHMREHGLHKNLFKHNATGGTGKPASGTSSGNNASKMPERANFATEEDYAVAYQTWRDAYNADGSPTKKA
jgi:hypothetical protein